MDNDELSYEGPLGEVRFLPVPKEFWSFEKESPFRRCTVCNLDLLKVADRFEKSRKNNEGFIELNPDEQYQIEKAYKNGEVIFEYAICNDCSKQLSAEFSRQSVKLITNFVEEHVDLPRRRQQLFAQCGNDEPTASLWLSRCFITGKPVSECKEYHILAGCHGEQLLLCDLPFLISSEAMEIFESRLSKKTRGSLDGFVEKFLGLPPAVKHSLPCLV